MKKLALIFAALMFVGCTIEGDTSSGGGALTINEIEAGEDVKSSRDLHEKSKMLGVSRGKMQSCGWDGFKVSRRRIR